MLSRRLITPTAPGEYVLILDDDATINNEQHLNVANVQLTLIGVGKEITVRSTSGSGRTFVIAANNASLTLGKNITLAGNTVNVSDFMIDVSNGTLNMLEGSKITGHTTSVVTGAITIYGTNTYFNMKGGEITGNHTTSNHEQSTGGVYVNYGATFTMSGGSITGNTRGDALQPRDVYLNGAESITKSSHTGGVIGVAIPALPWN